MYITDAWIQNEPGVTDQLIQFSEMGVHCRRLARKNVMVHAVIKPIMTHEMMENALEVNILGRMSADTTTILGNEYAMLVTFDRKELQLLL